MDDLTPMVSDEYRNLETGDVVVNVGTVHMVRSAGDDHVFVEFTETISGFSRIPSPLFGKIYRSTDEVIRWAREGEV